MPQQQAIIRLLSGVLSVLCRFFRRFVEPAQTDASPQQQSPTVSTCNGYLFCCDLPQATVGGGMSTAIMMLLTALLAGQTLASKKTHNKLLRLERMIVCLSSSILFIPCFLACVTSWILFLLRQLHWRWQNDVQLCGFLSFACSAKCGQTVCMCVLSSLATVLIASNK